MRDEQGQQPRPLVALVLVVRAPSVVATAAPVDAHGEVAGGIACVVATGGAMSCVASVAGVATSAAAASAPTAGAPTAPPRTAASRSERNSAALE